ncbi:carbohydrate porin [Pirellulaceae bacterium SH449]
MGYLRRCMIIRWRSQSNQVLGNDRTGGRVMKGNRPDDAFGIGLFHLGLSDEFRTLAGAVLPQRHEEGLEWFYNRAIANNIRATTDLQVARTSTVGSDTAIITVVRLEVFPDIPRQSLGTRKNCAC